MTTQGDGATSFYFLNSEHHWVSIFLSQCPWNDTGHSPCGFNFQSFNIQDINVNHIIHHLLLSYFKVVIQESSDFVCSAQVPRITVFLATLAPNIGVVCFMLEKSKPFSQLVSHRVTVEPLRVSLLEQKGTSFLKKMQSRKQLNLIKDHKPINLSGIMQKNNVK